MTRFGFARVAVAAFALGVIGRTSLPSGRPAPRDPLERFNRSVFKMNTALDHTLLRPLARDSQRLPGPVTEAIGNFVSNLMYPITLVNDLLQGKFHDTANDRARLMLNTTVGVAGVLDPATAVGLARNCEDFGITLGTWGMPSEIPYIEAGTDRGSIASRLATTADCSFGKDFARQAQQREGARGPIKLPMTRGDIGSYLGLAEETVVRSLKRLSSGPG